MIRVVRIYELDLTALRALREESIREGFRFVERLCEDWITGANRFDGRGEALFVAMNDEEVAGVCGLNRDTYLQDLLTGRVRRLYVLEKYRNIGVGRALLGAVIAHAQGNFRRLRVRTDSAGDYYTARGFRSVHADAKATHVLELPVSDS